MSNSIGSLRFLDAMDWREFVETMSVVEQALREDTGGVYGKMDFPTRDRYRHVVGKDSEEQPAVRKRGGAQGDSACRESAAHNDGNQGCDDRPAHVGFYLIDKGLAQLEQLAEARLSVSEALRKLSSRFPLLLYSGTIMLMTTIFSGHLLAKAHAGGLPVWALVLMGVLSLLCGSHLAVALVNWLATLLAMPHPLPRMDFSKGIPPELRTLVVVPTMLISAQNIEDLIEALEVRFLANRDDSLHFALLTDFKDAREEMLPEDGPLLLLARQRIEELNEKYKSLSNDAFFLSIARSG